MNTDLRAISSASLAERFRTIERLLAKARAVVHRTDVFPSSLRIVGSPRCCATCILGAAANGFCHGEGLSHLYDAPDLPPLSAVRAVVQAIAPKSVKLIGMENTNVASVCDLIQTLRALGCSDISATWTNNQSILNRLSTFVGAGMSRLTVSVHQFALEDMRLLEAIVHCALSKKCSVKINRVLLNSSIADLPAMLRWVRDGGYLLRLFSLMQLRDATAAFAHEYVHWTAVANQLESDLLEVHVIDYAVANRQRYQFRYPGGAVIETNMPTVGLPHHFTVIPECRSCEWRWICEEGYLGCGLRLGPDGRCYPCLLRPELSFDAIDGS